MKKKILKAFFLSALLVGCVVVIVVFEVNQIPAGSSIAGILFGALLPFEFMSIQDFFDSTSWKTSQRRLKRGGFINNETFIRISFAYLYRIKVDDKYFLIQNGRNTGKYQPVGGVYKLQDEEKTVFVRL